MVSQIIPNETLTHGAAAAASTASRAEVGAAIGIHFLEIRRAAAALAGVGSPNVFTRSIEQPSRSWSAQPRGLAPVTSTACFPKVPLVRIFFTPLLSYTPGMGRLTCAVWRRIW